MSDFRKSFGVRTKGIGDVKSSITMRHYEHVIEKTNKAKKNLKTKETHDENINEQTQNQRDQDRNEK